MKLLGTPGSLIAGHHLKASYRWVVAFVLFWLASPLFLAAQNITCTLSFTPATGTAPLSTTATGGCTDVVGNIVSESLDWGDGTPPAPILVFGNFSLPHTYASPATFAATLSATDDLGQFGFITVLVMVTAPAPTCTLSLSPPSVANGIQVTATGNCSDPGGVIVSTQLDWGDGTVVPGVTSGTHAYAAPGSFTVKVSATNSGGLTGSVSQPIIVTVNAPPTCTLTVTPLTGIAPPPLQVTATGSCSDPEGDITSISVNRNRSCLTMRAMPMSEKPDAVTPS
jgi:PKD repeat protein